MATESAGTPLDRVGASVTVVATENIEARQTTKVEDILKNKATTHGVEMFIDYRVFDDADGSLTVAPNYTYTQAYKRASFDELTRRPRHAVGGDITWRFLDRIRRHRGTGMEKLAFVADPTSTPTHLERNGSR